MVLDGRTRFCQGSVVGSGSTSIIVYKNELTPSSVKHKWSFIQENILKKLSVLYKFNNSM
jgi:hypothetical protein